MDVKDMLLQCKSNVFSKQYQCNYFIKVMILFFFISSISLEIRY